MAKQKTDVLAGGNEVILNLLPPASSPPCPFKAVTVRCIRKAALHQVHSPPPVPPRRPALALCSCLRNFFLAIKALNPTSAFCFGALRPQGTGSTSARFGHILVSFLFRALLPTSHLLSGGTA